MDLVFSADTNITCVTPTHPPTQTTILNHEQGEIYQPPITPKILKFSGFCISTVKKIEGKEHMYPLVLGPGIIWYHSITGTQHALVSLVSPPSFLISGLLSPSSCLFFGIESGDKLD